MNNIPYLGGGEKHMECRHRKQCSSKCPLFVTNDKFKEHYKVSCVLEAIWNKIDNLESEIEYHNHNDYINIYEYRQLEEKVNDLERDKPLFKKFDWE